MDLRHLFLSQLEIAHMNLIQCIIKFVALLVFLQFVTPGFSLAISTQDIIKLKKEGYTDQQIRQIIEKEKNEKDQDRYDKLEILRTLEEAISYISFYGKKRGQVAIDKVKLKVTEKEITQTVLKDTKHNTGPDGNFGYRERVKINIPFKGIKSVKVKTHTVDEQNLPPIWIVNLLYK